MRPATLTLALAFIAVGANAVPLHTNNRGFALRLAKGTATADATPAPAGPDHTTASEGGAGAVARQNRPPWQASAVAQPTTDAPGWKKRVSA
ncbi:hypothetical protein B0H10DRAFT_2227390 [Mycena sp. CBHHK59/15]|nr:hypothetical protein B0H10DRAFT_2227390 [Mycena sp. CBHHK59/15]